MYWHRKISILLLGIPIVVGACFNLKQPRHKIDFYTLEYGPPQISGSKAIAAVIRMERFSVAPTYNTNRIIYRDGSFKRDEYVYHKWRANPGDLVTCFLSRDIRESGLFKAVLSRDSISPSSYMLEGSVDEFFEYDMEDTWKAVLSLNITLLAENGPDISKRILFQKTYGAEDVCKQKNPRALAEAMSQAMAKISQQIIKDVYSYLERIQE
jgi:cholesterol transport system auxiliary component